MMAGQTYSGSCFCGAVKLTVSGEPAGMGYCHCESCRHWSAGPVNGFSLWQPDALKITSGQEHISSFAKTPASERKWCKQCGGHLYTNHPAMGLVDVYAAILPELEFTPGLHVHCQESVLAIADSLPRMKDLPAEMGGSGETL
ncbi:MAG: GFA family protein [Pseudomonadales bacterium]|nr:GFA family protein [Pseudomonadales bacterium]